MAKTICGAALVAVLISACGGESETIPPPQAPPPQPPPVAAPPPEPTPAPPPEPPKPSLLELEKQAAKNGLAALNAHEAAKFAEIFAPDGVSVIYGFGENKGREAIASELARATFSTVPSSSRCSGPMVATSAEVLNSEM